MFYSNLKRFLASLTLAIAFLFIANCSITYEGLSTEGEILSKKAIEISSFTLSVNGQEIQSFESEDLDKEISGIDALIFGAKKYGIFVVSTEKFNKSKKAGVINSENINLKIDDLLVSIEPVNKILVNLKKEHPIWVRRLHNRKSKTFSFDSQPYTSLNNSSYLKKLPWPDYSVDIESYEKIPNKNLFALEQDVAKVVGGREKLIKKIKYPKQAREDNVRGLLRVKFVVDEDGNTYDFEFYNRLGSGCENEALRAIRTSKFKPSIVNGHPAPSYLVIPIYFGNR